MTEFCLILDYGADRILLYYRELFIPCIRVKRLANFDWINIYFLWEKILYSFLLFVFLSVSWYARVVFIIYFVLCIILYVFFFFFFSLVFWIARVLFFPDFRFFISKLECKSVIHSRFSLFHQ